MNSPAPAALGPFPQLTMPCAVILDLDNCCADDAWRIPQIDWTATDPDARYHVYHALGFYDGPAQLPERLKQLIDARCIDQLHIVTSRPARYRQATESWLRANGVYDIAPVVTLNMRPAFDHRPSPDVKRDAAATLWVEAISKLRFPSAASTGVQIDIHVFDDRADCLHAIEAALPVPSTLHLCAIHAEDAYDAPRRPSTKAPAHTAERRTAADILEAMAATMRERNAVYKDNFRMVAPIMRVLFPAGVPPELVATDKFHLVELIIVKLTRFAASNFTHTDSIHDAGVYAALVQQCLIEESTQENHQ